MSIQPQSVLQRSRYLSFRRHIRNNITWENITLEEIDGTSFVSSLTKLCFVEASNTTRQTPSLTEPTQYYAHFAFINLACGKQYCPNLIKIWICKHCISTTLHIQIRNIFDIYPHLQLYFATRSYILEV